MKEQISDLFNKIQGESSGLGNLLSKIPGLDGYMERSRRREADQLLRKTIADRLESSRLQLGGITEELSRDIIKAIDHAEPLGRVDTRLMGLIGKVKDAPQGYAGFFDAIKVKEEDLARIYAFDENMLNLADAIGADTAVLETAVLDDGDISGSIRALDSALKEANSTFDGRDEVIKGIGEPAATDDLKSDF
jgi:sirohydrochlorin ferrochelatase